jgi:DNA-binding LytR/AlgR family response regulator
MKVFIAEDEVPARERLVETLARVAPEAVVVGHAASVAETRRWLATHDEPDVLLLDIQLADGLSLELFREGQLTLPTVFTTAFDEFALAAFDALAVAYLLKPVSDERLRAAFDRVRALRERFSAQAAQVLLERLSVSAASAGSAPPGRPAAQPQRQRWLARKGAAFVAVPVEQVAWFVSLDKLSFAVTHDGQRHLLDETLAEIEAALDPGSFFRVNRQVIVAAQAIRRFTPVGRGRLALELSPPLDSALQVPQERAAAFRQWLAR